jgi:ribA/ribD-fused uncharacterized protein
MLCLIRYCKKPTYEDSLYCSITCREADKQQCLQCFTTGLSRDRGKVLQYCSRRCMGAASKKEKILIEAQRQSAALLKNEMEYLQQREEKMNTPDDPISEIVNWVYLGAHTFRVYGQKIVGFYEKECPFYELTNFHLGTFDVGGQLFSSAEHAFQRPKHLSVPIDKYNKLSCMNVFKLPGVCVEDWHSGGNVRHMVTCVFNKFTQDDALQEQLMGTGNAFLVEDSGDKDYFWGNGKTGSFGSNMPGKNYLGLILMSVRKYFQQNN